MHEGGVPCNQAKNRYSNIKPYDISRVQLMPVEGKEGSDYHYINASWIPVSLTALDQLDAYMKRHIIHSGYAFYLVFILSVSVRSFLYYHTHGAQANSAHPSGVGK